MKQAMPVPGKQQVAPIATQGFLDMQRRRVEEGMATYGTALMTHNGRDAVLDAEQEACDLWNYLAQIRMERDDMRATLAAVEAERDRLAMRLERQQELRGMAGRALEKARRDMRQVEAERDALAEELAEVKSDRDSWRHCAQTG